MRVLIEKRKHVLLAKHDARRLLDNIRPLRKDARDNIKCPDPKVEYCKNPAKHLDSKGITRFKIPKLNNKKSTQVTPVNLESEKSATIAEVINEVIQSVTQIKTASDNDS